VVTRPGIGTPTDTELAQAVRAALELAEAVRHQRIRSTVSHGLVTLYGMVDQRSQREAAERAVQRTPACGGEQGDHGAAQLLDADEGQDVSTETCAQGPELPDGA
jgi:BON domain